MAQRSRVRLLLFAAVLVACSETAAGGRERS